MYILNQLQTKVLSGRTPYEAWTGKKPDLKFVKVFGCTTFMKIPSVHTRKLDDRSKAVLNLGKELGTKAYRLYDPKNGSVCVSRDVVFAENKAWTWENVDERQNISFGSLIVGGLLSTGGNLLESDYGTYATPTQTRSDNEDRGENTDLTSSVDTSSSSSSTESTKFRLLSEVYDES